VYATRSPFVDVVRVSLRVAVGIGDARNRAPRHRAVEGDALAVEWKMPPAVTVTLFVVPYPQGFGKAGALIDDETAVAVFGGKLAR